MENFKKPENMEDKFKCKACGWQGSRNELEDEKVESCMGDDTIEACPECGSMNVFQVFD
jgi:predicted RNA-binding Zn-ribbon protein involved in translation (DUF1610 family)